MELYESQKEVLVTTNSADDGIIRCINSTKPRLCCCTVCLHIILVNK